MIESDPSTRRRLSDLEANVAALQRQLDARITRPPVLGFPRDRWLGRTVANGQTYPTSGDTFFVELLSAAFSPETPGASTVTERERGTVVLARTWPEKYLAECTDVIVDRIKGVGTGGSWWVQTSADAVQYAWLYGGSSITYPLGSQAYPLPAGESSYELLTNTVDLNGNPAFPDGTAMGTAGQSLGTRLQVTKRGLYSVAAQANVFSSTLVPDGYGAVSVAASLWLDVKKANQTETILRGADAASLGAGDQWLTVRVIGTLYVNAPEVVNLWLYSQRGYFQYTSWRVVNWEAVLTRLDD